jgi:hypothetical protein
MKSTDKIAQSLDQLNKVGDEKPLFQPMDQLFYNDLKHVPSTTKSMNRYQPRISLITGTQGFLALSS